MSSEKVVREKPIPSAKLEEIEELKEEGIETEMIPWINDNEN